jgi:Yip1-like protein
MIKALLLMIFPGATWDGIAEARRSVISVFALFLLPLLVLTSAAEAYGLVHWGKPQGQIVVHVRLIPRGEAILFEVLQILLSVLVVFLSAGFIRAMGDTFHTRSTYRDSFGLAAYGLSPLFFMRLFDAFPGASPWLTWAVGIGLSAMVVYHGVPRMMQPDLPHAFGLFVTSAMTLLMATGMVRFVTAFLLQGKLPGAEDFMVRLAAQWHL